MASTYASTYDGSASQFAGGGFMPSQGQATGSAQKRGSFENRHQTLRALTAKQLADASAQAGEDGLVVDGQDVSNVTLVGKITAVDEQSLLCVYTLDDGTGTVSAKYWIPETDDEAERVQRAEWRVGAYVRVHGHVNAFNRERVLVAFAVRAVTDYNELTYHLSQVIFQHLHILRAAQGGGAAGAGAGPGAAAAAAAAIAGAGSGVAGSVAAPYNPGGLTPAQAQVLGIFNAGGADSDVGLTARDVVARSAGALSPADVAAAVEVLQNEGHLYSTIDDSHFKPCNPV